MGKVRVTVDTEDNKIRPIKKPRASEGHCYAPKSVSSYRISERGD